MTVRVASVQTDVVFNEPSANIERLSRVCANLGDQGCQLAVFPECFLTGYCVESADEATRISLACHADENCEVVNGDPVFETIREVSRAHNIHIVVGFAGRDDQGLLNGAVLVEPSGRIRRYVKTHLPELGLDNFVRRGDRLCVFDTEIGRLGLFICFDLRPPEVARCLALQGADILVLPTNWPDGTMVPSRLLAPARAAENKCFLITANRIGKENGWGFCGLSGIYDVTGEPLAKAAEGEEILVADLDLQKARTKRNNAGGFVTELFQSRTPSLYGSITENLNHE